MSKRKDPVARARGRKAAPVKKPFPLGFVVGSTVLAAFLIGILVYAVQNEGVGDRSSLKYAESQISDLVVSKRLTAKHVDGEVAYPNETTTPPVGGEHNGVPQSCQAYTQPIASERAVHSLEHGAVWITYDPDKATKDDVKKLTDALESSPYRMLSPYPGLKSKISLQAWGEQVFVDSVDDKRIERFLELFTEGPQLEITGERGAACSGSTATGPLSAAPPGASAPSMPAATPTK